MRESKVETKVIKYAEKQGWLVIKLNGPGFRGLPDRLFLKANRVMFIEFKATGKTLRKLQEYRCEEIAKQGFSVYSIDSIEDGLKLFGENNNETTHTRYAA